MMKNLERCKEICLKLERISQALMEEATELMDDDIADLAAILGVIGGAYLLPRDRFIIKEFFDMYSAKKIIETMRGGFGNSTEEGFNPDDPITNG
jgi:hypothetical protein